MPSQRTPAWQRKTNHFKKQLRAGIPATAMWMTIPWPAVAEMSGESRLDAVLIDLEHSSYGLAVVEQIIVAAQLAGVSAIVRPGSSSPDEIGRVLNTAPDGIVFPLVSDGASARQAWASVRYPPAGVRGWGGSHTRQAKWQGRSVAEVLRDGPSPDDVYSTAYVDKTTDNIVTIFTVETPNAVAKLKEILDEGSPDLISFGMGDFAAAVDFDMAACQKAFDKVYEICRERNVGMSLPPSTLPTHFYPGCFSVVGIDSLLLSQAISAAMNSVNAYIESAAR